MLTVHDEDIYGVKTTPYYLNEESSTKIVITPTKTFIDSIFDVYTYNEHVVDVKHILYQLRVTKFSFHSTEEHALDISKYFLIRYFRCFIFSRYGNTLAKFVLIPTKMLWSFGGKNMMFSCLKKGCLIESNDTKRTWAKYLFRFYEELFEDIPFKFTYMNKYSTRRNISIFLGKGLYFNFWNDLFEEYVYGMKCYLKNIIDCSLQTHSLK